VSWTRLLYQRVRCPLSVGIAGSCEAGFSRATRDIARDTLDHRPTSDNQQPIGCGR